jgi:SAM-dependent methyltransferase
VARVSHFLAFLVYIGSPCLRHCVHGASIGDGGGGGGGSGGVPQQFDVVLGADLLYTRSYARKVAAVAAQLLRPGGLLVLTTPLARSGYATVLAVRTHSTLRRPPAHPTPFLSGQRLFVATQVRDGGLGRGRPSPPGGAQSTAPSRRNGAATRTGACRTPRSVRALASRPPWRCQNSRWGRPRE